MRHIAKVISVVRESNDVSTISFTVNGATLPYIAGQYICVYFTIPGQPESKAYSLSSAPSEPVMAITVKKIGAFSERLCALNVGDALTISQPFGYFNTRDELPIIAIASGVGIAPIWSIIKDEFDHIVPRPITVHMSAQSQGGLIFKDALHALFSTHSQCRVHCYVTQETPSDSIGRRFVVASDVDTTAIAHARFYVCGSEAFVSALWRQLVAAKVDESRIVTEVFFEASLQERP